MWLLAGFVVCGVVSSSTATTTTPTPGRFEWGWRLSPTTTGHYYVKLPQKDGTGAEHSVSYTADASGYHGAAALATTGQHHSHTATIAVGERAVKLLQQDPARQRLTTNPNSTTEASDSIPLFLSSSQPPEAYLLQQFTSPELHNDKIVEIFPNSNTLLHTPPLYTSNGLNTPTQYVVEHPLTPSATAAPAANEKTEKRVSNKSEISKESNERSSIQNGEVRNENSDGPDPVHVYKDHICTEEVETERKPGNPIDNMQSTTKLYAESPSYRERAHENFNQDYGIKVHGSRDKQNANEITKEKTINEGISKLVSSTQDLISNEDLLTINHAAERDVYFHYDELIKPRARNAKSDQSITYENFVVPDESNNKLMVRARVENIVDSENSRKVSSDDEQLLQTSSNEYKFSSPIIVQDSVYNDVTTEIRNNIISTLVPYLEDTLSEARSNYESKDIAQSNNASKRKGISDDDKEKMFNLSIRPISQKYLAPITAALRLVNADDTDVLNYVDDHEVSDSEIVTATAQAPEDTKEVEHEQRREGKTTVEIQPSIPIEITKINDIIVHDDDEGRFSKNNRQQSTIYRKHAEALESSRKIQQNMNDNLYRYGAMIIYALSNYTKNQEIDTEIAKENIESSANTQTEIQINPNTQNNGRKDYVIPYQQSFGNKIIQPITIEKEMPVTKFVHRLIEQKIRKPAEIVEVEKKAVPGAVPVEKIVEKPVTKYIDHLVTYPVHVPHPVSVEVPFPVEHKVYIDRPVHVPYTVEKDVERQIIQQIPTAIPVPVEARVPVKQNVPYPVSVEKPVPVLVEIPKAVPVPVEIPKPVPVPVEIPKPVPIKTVIEKEVSIPYPVDKPYPVPYTVEKKIPVPVERIVEKPITVTKIVEKPVHIQVPVPQPLAVPVHVPQPYPVDRIVEKKIPYPVTIERVVEKKVQVPVQVPYPVEKIVEKIVEKPIAVFKYVDKPYPVEKRVPYPVQKIVERRIPYPVQVPVEVKIPYHVDRLVEKPVHIPVGIPYAVEKIVEKPVNVVIAYDTIQQEHPEQNSYQQNQNIRPLYRQHFHVLPQYFQHVNNQQNNNQNIQSTAWGNLYASTYQYINNTPEAKINDLKTSQSLKKYVGYLADMSDKHKSPYMYYGPPPTNAVSVWESHSPANNYLLEFKLRRTDRTAKVGNLRIEYGGFKPPLIPSTEVDSNGIPINCDEET